jgi:hypothetical protein
MISRWLYPVNPVDSKENPGLASAQAWNRAADRLAGQAKSARAGMPQELR